MIKLLTNLILTLVILAFPVQAYAATLSLSPSTGSFKKGCNFSLNIDLNTNGVQTDGTDAIIQYDQSKITATSITSGSIYPDYPGNSIDDNAGKATISGLASVSTPFSSSGTLATINFTVKDVSTPSATLIKFQFDSNDKTNTTDSNVVERGTIADVLSSVVNGNYTVGATGACANPTPVPRGAPTPGSTATPSATIAPVPNNLDCLVNQVRVNGMCQNIGAAELTFTVAIVGSVLTILGILGLALL